MRSMTHANNVRSVDEACHATEKHSPYSVGVRQAQSVYGDHAHMYPWLKLESLTSRENYQNILPRLYRLHYTHDLGFAPS